MWRARSYARLPVSAVSQGGRRDRLGGRYEQTDHPDRRRRSHGLGGDHARSEHPLRRGLPHRAGDFRRPGARRTDRARAARRAGRVDRCRPADAADDGRRDARAGSRPRSGGEVPAAHGVRRHRRRHQGDQRHRPGLLPAQAMGSSRGSAVSRHRRSARRLAAGQSRAHVRRAGHRASVVRPQPRDQKLPGPQLRALPLVRHRARCRGPTAARPRRRDRVRAPARPHPRRRNAPRSVDARPRRRARPAHESRAAAVRRVHRGRRTGRPGCRRVLGVRKGLTGSDLTQRALAQVSRFGAEVVLARDVVGFETRGPVRAVLFDGSGEIEARALIVATGVSYRRLDADGLDELTGRGVYYGTNASEASQCQGDDVYIVGAANSAGQAALNLSRFAKRVVLVVRAATLKDTMSQYLIERITSAPNVEVRYRSEVVAARGDGHLEALMLADRDSGVTDEVSSSWLFVFIGASPRTEWLGPDIARDDKGFVVTGQDLAAHAHHWPLARAPLNLETSVPGVFAAGDVRLDSMKRVASAVGEGAMSVYLVHRYLATI